MKQQYSQTTIKGHLTPFPLDHIMKQQYSQTVRRGQAVGSPLDHIMNQQYSQTNPRVRHSAFGVRPYYETTILSNWQVSGLLSFSVRPYYETTILSNLKSLFGCENSLYGRLFL